MNPESNNIHAVIYDLLVFKEGYGVTLQPGILLLIKAAATSAFGLPMSSFLQVESIEKPRIH